MVICIATLFFKTDTMESQRNLPAPAKTSLYEYVAQHNLDGVNTLLNKYGVPSQTTVPDATYCLKVVCAKKGASTLKEVADIHPDKYLIREFITGGMHANADGQFSNCSGSCGCGKSNISGENLDLEEQWPKSTTDNKAATDAAVHNANTMGMVMIFSVLALTFAIIYKNH